MRRTFEDIAQKSATTGFAVETLEKVFRLLDLLSGVRSHPFLRERVALKGGTALNLFCGDMPRLSVDIDLNYIGAIARDAMLADVPKVKQAITAVCGRENITVERVPKDHAGGKWRLGYERVDGRTGMLELDVNFMLRAPLWTPTRRHSLVIGRQQATDVLVLDDHELAAGKLAAMIARSAARDLFDARALLARDDLDRAKLRLAFVVYGGMSRRDWRAVSLEDITADTKDVERALVPMLRADLAPPKEHIAEWTAALVSECRDRMSAVLPLEEDEREFLDRLNNRGEILPELITQDEALQQRIGSQPQLQWKALNVKQHRGS